MSPFLEPFESTFRYSIVWCGRKDIQTSLSPSVQRDGSILDKLQLFADPIAQSADTSAADLWFDLRLLCYICPSSWSFNLKLARITQEGVATGSQMRRYFCNGRCKSVYVDDIGSPCGRQASVHIRPFCVCYFECLWLGDIDRKDITWRMLFRPFTFDPWVGKVERPSECSKTSGFLFIMLSISKFCLKFWIEVVWSLNWCDLTSSPIA
jgi:hypothetical protein